MSWPHGEAAPTKLSAAPRPGQHLPFRTNDEPVVPGIERHGPIEAWVTVNERERLRRDDLSRSDAGGGYVYDNQWRVRGLRDGLRSIRQTWGPCPKSDALALVRPLKLSMRPFAPSLVTILLLAA